MLIYNGIFAQSAWLRAKGETYLQFSTTGIFNYNSLFLGDMDYDLHTRGTDISVQLYGEYGLTENMTLFGSIPFKHLNFKETDSSITVYEIDPISGIIYDNGEITLPKGGTLFGLSNIDLGIRQLVLDRDLIMSVQLAISIPTISSDSNKGLRTGYDATILKPGLSVGYSKQNYFIQCFVGYEYFNNNYSDRFKGYLEAGVQFKGKLWLIAYLDILESLNNGSRSEMLYEWMGLYVDNQEYAAVGFKLIYELNEQFGITFNPGGAFSAYLLPKSAAYTLGTYLKF